MNIYKLKLTALTPIHIGTGEVYEPTNFVIDSGYLYEFDEIKFYQNLDNKAKKEFLKAVESSNDESLFNIHKIIKQNKLTAIKSAKNKVQVSKGVQKDYDNKIGRVVQMEGGRRVQKRKVFNQFQIERTIRQQNTKKVYIPGSSIKGSINTAMMEYFYKKGKKIDANPNKELLKNLSISDTQSIKTFAMVAYALNKERFEEDELGPKILLESIYSSTKQQSIFETTLNFKDLQSSFDIDFDTLKQACNQHYLPIFQQLFKPNAIFREKKIEEWTNEYFSDEFYERYKDFKLKDNQFLLRIGKYSQARAVTIDGMRKIRVKVSGGGPRRKPNKWETLDQETTTWMFGFNQNASDNLMPFGWILCEILN